MKSSHMWIIVFLGVCLLFSQSAYSTGTAAISMFYEYGDTVWAGNTGEFFLVIGNSDKIGTMRMGFRIYSPDGVTFSWVSQDGGYGPSQAVTVTPGCRLDPPEAAFESGLIINEDNFPDKIHISAIADTAGLQPGPMELMLGLHLNVNTPGWEYPYTLCIDTVTVAGPDDWVFRDALTSDVMNLNLVNNGHWCWPVTWYSPCPILWSESSIEMTFNHCEVGHAQVRAENAMGEKLTYRANPIIPGNGTLEMDINGGSADIYYTVPQGSPVDYAEYEICADCNSNIPCSGITIPLVITAVNTTPVLDPGASYDGLRIGCDFVKDDFNIEDVDECDEVEVTVISGPGYFDNDLNTYVFTPGPGDVGNHTIELEATDGDVTGDIKSFTLFVNDSTDPLPGNANCDQVVNIGDAIFLVNYIFKGGRKPPVIDWADPNGDCAINIGDAVYLVNYIFKGGQAPVVGCAK